MAANDDRIVLGVTIPAWVFEQYAWTGEIRLPRKAEYFWSELKGQVVLGICDETTGGPRVILAWRENSGNNMRDVRKNVQPGRSGSLKLVREEDGEAPGGPEVPEVPPGEPKGGDGPVS